MDPHPSPGGYAGTLQTILNFLHNEGLYAAEEALLREVENRYPNGCFSSGSDTPGMPQSAGDFGTASGPPSSAADEAGGSTCPHSPEDGEAAAATAMGSKLAGAAEGEQLRNDAIIANVVEAEQQQQQLEESALAAPSEPSFSHGIRRPPSEQQHADEYEDDMDPGYVREEVADQEGFIASELCHHHEASRRSYRRHSSSIASGYSSGGSSRHSQRSQQQQQYQLQEAGSSGGADVLASSATAADAAGQQQAAASSAGEPSQFVSEAAEGDGIEGVVVLLDPVQPEPPRAESTEHAGGSEANSEVSVTEDGSGGDVGLAGAAVPPAAAAGAGATDQWQQQQQEEEAPVFGSSAGPRQQEAAGGNEAQSLLSPLSVFGKLFSPGGGGLGGARRAAPTGGSGVSGSSSSSADAQRGGQHASTAAGTRQPLSTGQRKQRQQQWRHRQHSRGGSSAAGEEGDGEAEQGEEGEGGEGEATFSFPVTPSSKGEPAEPVFPSWPSFKSYELEGSCGGGGPHSVSPMASPTGSRSSVEPCTSHGGSYGSSPETSRLYGGGSGDHHHHHHPYEAPYGGSDGGHHHPRHSGNEPRGELTHFKRGSVGGQLDQLLHSHHRSPSSSSGGAGRPLLPATVELASSGTDPLGAFAAAAAAGGNRQPSSLMHGGAPHALYDYDEDAAERSFEVLTLRVYHRKGATGFEEAKDLSLAVGDVVAGRYQVSDFLGSAAFSTAVQAVDLKTGTLVCLKVVKNNKDYFDQSLDEVKLLRYVNAADPLDQYGILRLYDFFYYKEHLLLVCELLRANLYEFQKYNRDSGDEPYFTLPRIQSIARQVLRSLAFLHSLGLMHCDLKPENVLIKSYSRCEVKVIDLGSSCFVTDHLSSYVQSRSYRAPEVVLGLPYAQKIDMWSLGCILAELASGLVLFQNDSVPSMLCRMEGILGPLPSHMLARGRYTHRLYTRHGELYERNSRTGLYEVLRPKRSSLAARVPQADRPFLDFLASLLQPHPSRRPSAEEALAHPWLCHNYPAAAAPAQQQQQYAPHDAELADLPTADELSASL